MRSELVMVILLVVYSLAIVFFIAWIVNTAKKKKSFKPVFLVEGLSAVIALGLMMLFDNLPGYGFMPGFTWLGCMAISVMFAGVCIILIVASSIVWAVMHKKGSEGSEV